MSELTFIIPFHILSPKEEGWGTSLKKVKFLKVGNYRQLPFLVVIETVNSAGHCFLSSAEPAQKWD